MRTLTLATLATFATTTILTSASAQNVPGYGAMRKPVWTPEDQAVPAEETASPWKGEIGLGIFYIPEYEGGENHDETILPWVDVQYGDNVSLNLYRGLRYSFVNEQGFELGTGLAYNIGREEDQSGKLTGLGDIDATPEFLLYGLYSRDRFIGEITFAHDIGDAHDGYRVEFDLGYVLTGQNNRLYLRPSVSTTYANGDYMQSFFGITQNQSLASGLNAYDANDNGFKDVSANLFARYQLTSDWAFNGLVSYSRIIGEAEDSPLVEDSSQITAGTFLSYGF